MTKIKPTAYRIIDGDLYCDVSVDHASSPPGMPPAYEIDQDGRVVCVTRSMLEHLINAIDMIER
jgi:hypothetical protein